jgi:hypothetical protein
MSQRSQTPARVPAATIAVTLALACAPPATDLSRAAGSPSSPPPAGSAAAVGSLMEPMAGAVDVPSNLAAVIVRFTGPIDWGAAGIQVCDGEGGPVPSSAPAEVPCDAGSCYRTELGGLLPAGVTCQVAIGDGIADAAGKPIAPGVIGVFDTASARDQAPPVLGGVTVDVAGPCLTVSFSTDEPATGTVVIQAGEAQVETQAGLGTTTFSVSIPIAGLPAEAAATVTISVVDRAGNVAASSPVPFETPVAVPPIAITEVVANAAGPEPAQEYVELRNMSEEPIELAGLRVEDAKGADELPAATLPGGAYALVVPSGYDPEQGQDVPPRPGTALLRVDSRLGADGLANGGERVRLMLGEAVVSSYGGWVDVSASNWAGKGVHRLVQTACDRAESWNRVPLDATPGAAPP